MHNRAMRLSVIFRPISRLRTHLPNKILPSLSTGRGIVRFLSSTHLPPGVREITPEMAERLLKELPLEPGELEEEEDKRYRRPATKIRTPPTARALSQAVSIGAVLGNNEAKGQSEGSLDRKRVPQDQSGLVTSDSLKSQELGEYTTNPETTKNASLEELEFALEEVFKTEELTSEILDNMKGLHRYRRQGEILVKESSESNDVVDDIDLLNEMDEEGIDDHDSFDELEDYSLPEDPQRVAQTVGGEGIYSFELREEDMMEQFIRGSGPGGQSVNKTKNCVYLRHVPTGTVVKCQQTRSLNDNRHIARKIMKLKLQSIHLGPNSKQAQRAAKIRKRKQRSKRRHAKKHNGSSESDVSAASSTHYDKSFVDPLEPTTKPLKHSGQTNQR